jgi:hypothetical protein
MSAASSIHASSAEYLAWAIFNADAAGASGIALMDAFNGATRLILALGLGTGSGQWGFYDGAWQGFAANATGLQMLVWDLRNGVGTAKGFKNGVQEGVGKNYTSRPVSTGGGGGLRIGSIFDGSAWHLNGQLVEFGIGLAPSDTRRQKLHKYGQQQYPLLGVAA